VLGANKVTAVLTHNVAQNMWHMLEDEARANKEETAKRPNKFKSPKYLAHLCSVHGNLPITLLGQWQDSPEI
jgi:hypothetical protein